MRFISTGILVLIAAAAVAAEERSKVHAREEPKLAALFAEQDLRGTFVVADRATQQLVGHNVERAHQRFIPASTFKIPNSLIALENRAVADVDEVVPYGGKPQPLPQWERNLSMREAIKVSAVPIYQELARRVGLEKMLQSVKELNYGNAEVGEKVDRFWLDGPLKISAVEQVRFLQRLVDGGLRAKPENVAAVREITLLEKTDRYRLHGKTGWCTSVEPHIGWFVGWVEEGGSISIFALNVDMPGPTDSAKRIPLAKACLGKLGILR